MPSPSPLCTVKDGAGAPQTTPPYAVISSGVQFTISLASTANVDTWSITCIGADETTDATAVALTVNAIAKTATGTLTGAGKSLIFRSVINGATDINNVNRPDWITTFKVSILAANGLAVGCTNETTEHNGTYGWLALVNGAVRGAGGGIAISGSTPNAIGTAAPGSTGMASDAGHVHAHGNQPTTASLLHALVVSGGNPGFMSGADKALFDAALAAITALQATLTGGQLLKNFLTTAGTAVANVDTLIYTVPASPSGNFRALLAAVVGRLKTGLTGAGTVTVTVGTASGGNDLVLATAIVTATTVGTEIGVASAAQGTSFPAANLYNALLAAGATVYVRMATTGVVTVAPTFEWTLFGALMGT